MAQRARVPKFGNWESEQPYTVCFDKARKDRNGKMINPNDPQENPDMFPNAAPPAQAPPPSKFRPPVRDEPLGREAIKPTHERRVSRESVDGRNNNMGFPTANELSTQQRHGGRVTNSGRPSKRSFGSEHSIEQSPLHHNYPAKVGAKGSASPAMEVKNSNEYGHNTPGRSRSKPTNDARSNRGAAVPKFGDWDEKNPSGAEGYTHIFNKVREERYTVPPANVSSTDSRPPYNNLNTRKKASATMKCCIL